MCTNPGGPAHTPHPSAPYLRPAPQRQPPRRLQDGRHQVAAPGSWLAGGVDCLRKPERAAAAHSPADCSTPPPPPASCPTSSLRFGRGRGSPRTPRPVDHQLLPGPAPGPVPPARYPAPGSEVEARGHPSSCLTPGIEDVPQLPALRPCHPQHCSVPLPLTVHTCVHTVCTCTAKTYTHNVHEHTDTCMLHAEVHMCSRAYTHVQPLPPLRCHPAWPAQSKHVVGTAGRPTCLSSSLSFCSSQARPGSEGRSSEPCSLASWGWVP